MSCGRLDDRRETARGAALVAAAYYQDDEDKATSNPRPADRCILHPIRQAVLTFDRVECRQNACTSLCFPIVVASLQDETLFA
jgi:hypothetical protein